MTDGSSAVDAEHTEALNDALEQLLARHPPATVAPKDFAGAQFDAGLAWVHFPSGLGGLGMPRKLQALVTTRLEEAGVAPFCARRNPVGYGMAAPTIVAGVNEALKHRHLRPLFTCDEIWCQLFSEPGAGSDLAGISTRAVRDGDEWVVNGQKVWTTHAHEADFGLLLARTDPEVEKHRGLTYFAADMHARGVEVRPLRQMTGDAEFNEVFLTDVRIEDDRRLSAVGEGWRGALVTLTSERAFIGGRTGPDGGPIGLALELWRRTRTTSAVLRDRLARLWSEAEILRVSNLRAAASSLSGTPGPEGSVAKLASAELNQRIYELCVDLQGPTGALYDSFEMRQSALAVASLHPDLSAQRLFLRSRADTMAGGTSEVLRNVLAERVLGLPGDVRVDRDRPWSEVPRS